MNTEERTEYRVMFRGNWVGVQVADYYDALEYVRAAVAAGQNRADYSVQAREVVVVAEEWTEHLSWRAVDHVLNSAPQGA